VPVAAVPSPPPPPPAPEHPKLILVGTLTGGSERSIAVFVDQATREAVRLRPGEGYMGWILHSVKRSAATLQKGAQTETLEFPPTMVAQGPPGAPATVGSSGAALPSPAASAPPAGTPTAPVPPEGRIAIPGGGSVTPLPSAKPVPVTIPTVSAASFSGSIGQR
jgi:hypothetical protein